MKSKARNISFSSIRPNINICSYRNTDYSEYIYYSIGKLQSINKVKMSYTEKYLSYYMEMERYIEYHPHPSFSYTMLLEEISAINDIIMYKVICRERLFNSSCLNWNHKRYFQELTDRLSNEVRLNPHISYFELLDLFPEDEIELVMENLIEDNRLRYTIINQGKRKGKSVITIK